MLRRLSTAAAMMLISISSCARSNSRPLPRHYDYGTDYSFRLTFLNERNGESEERFAVSPREDTRGDHFAGKHLNGFTSVPGYGFWVDVTNTTARPMRLLWQEARYIDELEQAHTVYHYVIGERPPSEVLTPGPPTELGPGATTRQVISPGYKTYMIEETGEEHVFEEPLVPTTLKNRTLEQMKTYVHDLAKRQVPVKLVLPIEMEGKRYDYIFTFLLKPRWEAVPKL